MKKVLLFTCLLTIFPVTYAAVETIYPDRAAAVLFLDTQMGEQLAKTLYRQLQRQSAEQSLLILEQLKQEPGLSIINREYVYLKLSQMARFQAADGLNPVVFKFLINYQSQAQIVHPESSEGSLPVFNIRATAAGALALQQREHDLLTARSLEQQPVLLLNHYLTASIVSQNAIKEAALKLPMLQQQKLLAISLEQFSTIRSNEEQQNALTDLAAALALKQEDVNALAIIIAGANQQKLPTLLRDIYSGLSAEQAKPLLYLALHGSPQTAAIAVHYLGEYSSGDPEIYQDLLTWLAKPQIAVAAALALSNSKHPQVIIDLQHLSNSSRSGTARHAKLALELRTEAALEVDL